MQMGDMQFGRSKADFWRDVPDAPAQLAVSRLHLELGEWFLDTADGTPYRTQVLGKRTEGVRDATLRARILGTQGVDNIFSYGSALNRDTRQLTVTATVNTVYGPAKIKEPM